MLRKTKEVYDEFEKTNLEQFEKRALHSQMNFLKKSRESLPDSLVGYKIRIMKWSKAGKPISLKHEEFKISMDAILDIMNSMIIELGQVIERIDKGEEYSKMCEENTMNDFKRIAELLALPIELDPNKQNYPSMIIDI